MFVEVVNMTNNTQFKTLLNTWLNQKKPMITPSTHASFTLIAENHLIPYFGKRKIGSITETDIQSYISYLYNAGRLDNTGGLTVKTIRDVSFPYAGIIIPYHSAAQTHPLMAHWIVGRQFNPRIMLYLLINLLIVGGKKVNLAIQQDTSTERSHMWASLLIHSRKMKHLGSFDKVKYFFHFL